MRRSHGLAGILTLLAASSCALIAGIQDIELTSDGSSDGGLTGPSCGLEVVCAPEPPTGWKFVALGVVPPDGGPASPCPNGYSPSVDLLENPTGDTPSCPCACAPDAGPEYQCVAASDGGTATLNYNQGGCANSATYPVPIAAACQTYGFSGYDSFSMTVPAVVPAGSCPVVPTSIAPPASSAARVCAVEVDPLPSSCPQGMVCARDTTAPFIVCVESPDEQEGGVNDEACPAGFPTKHVLTTDVVDTRACVGSCQCEATATCGSPTVTFYQSPDAGCQPPSQTFAADGGCDTLSPAFVNGLVLTVPVQVTSPCALAQNTLGPHGSVSFNGSRTVCCP